MPFELGRPFGAPNDPAFQTGVLRVALALLEAPSGPVLEDYPFDAPTAAEEDAPWACAVPLPAPPPPETEAEALGQQLRAEIAMLRPWQAEARQRAGRTGVGASGASPDGMEEAAGVLLAAATQGTVPAFEAAAAAPPMLLRFVADDLKAYYFEAAAAQPGEPSSRDLNLWLFGETVLGDLLYRARDTLGASEDRGLQLVGRFLVPGAYNRRPVRE